MHNYTDIFVLLQLVKVSLFIIFFFLQKFIRTVPIKDIRSLCLKFPIFDCTEFYKTLVSRKNA